MHDSNRTFLLSVLLACIAAAGCAAPTAEPVASSVRGYDLRIDGNQVSLAFDRDLTVPEFLKLAQEVTAARYVYRQDEVAAAGPVSLMGRLQCERGKFGSFVDTMLHVHGLRAEPQGTGDAAYVEIRPIPRG
ncbi:MAG: hypothetical protein ABIP94_11110 [Planctomycetota bacterium]